MPFGASLIYINAKLLLGCFVWQTSNLYPSRRTTCLSEQQEKKPVSRERNSNSHAALQQKLERATIPLGEPWLHKDIRCS
ncbi:hypothetical protein, partial [Rhizobium rhizogenes]|uniref:hypothetical protein n=1 Tax=Rhizobium rhizogenes TaxID=359 RepID=UPI001AEDBAEE